MPGADDPEPSVAVVGPRRGGRPRLAEEPLSVFSCQLPKSAAEVIDAAARRRGMTRSALLREMVCALVRARMARLGRP
jgi:hypothetical protein